MALYAGSVDSPLIDKWSYTAIWELYNSAGCFVWLVIVATVARRVKKEKIVIDNVIGVWR